MGERRIAGNENASDRFRSQDYLLIKSLFKSILKDLGNVNHHICSPLSSYLKLFQALKYSL